MTDIQKRNTNETTPVNKISFSELVKIFTPKDKKKSPEQIAEENDPAINFSLRDIEF